MPVIALLILAEVVLTHLKGGILCGVHQDRSWVCSREVAQGWNASFDGHGGIEERLAALGLAADDADRLASPELVDEPAFLAREVFEARGVTDGGAPRGPWSPRES